MISAKRLVNLRLSALEDDAAEDVTRLMPKFLIELIDEIERLRAALTEALDIIWQQTGPLSKVRQRANELRKLTVQP